MTSPMTAVCVLRIGLQRHRAAQEAASNGRATANSHRILMNSGVISIASLVACLAGKTDRVAVPVEVRVAAFSQI